MPPRSVLNRVYDKEYYSGTQAALYIGDVFVDEIVAYSFAVSENKTPIYGYASQLFDARSKGPVLVQGNFAINFKESGYLYLILERYRQNLRAIDDAIRKATSDDHQITPEDRRLPPPFKKNSREEGILRVTIERILNGELNNEDKFDFFQTLAGYATVAGAPDKTFEDYAESFEDAVWGARPKDLDNEVRRPIDSIFDGFDIYFTFGDYNNPNANHTVQRIQNVNLTRVSKAVNVSGEPIAEQYEFFARNAY